jgi:cytochrome o ubiquinol oxidase subunit 2
MLCSSHGIALEQTGFNRALLGLESPSCFSSPYFPWGYRFDELRVGQNVQSPFGSDVRTLAPTLILAQLNLMMTLRNRGLSGLLAALPLLLLSGCKMVVMNPSGDIAAQQADLILLSTYLMLLIIVPVICLTLFFAWKYRQSNTQATYEPDWHHSTKLEVIIWGAPLAIIIALATVTWISTHRLDPFRPLDRIDEKTVLPADHKPIEIEAVALDWKWLFIYPEQGIATVNELVTPVNVPIRFKLTSSTVMNSFFIPAMAGQLYAMPGMQSTLNAVINKAGTYEGFSANYSGAGFSHMRFQYHAKTQAEFDQWVESTRKEAGSLNRAAYLQLEKPSQKDPVQRFSSVESGLFHAIVNRCVAAGSVCMDAQMMADAFRNRSNLSADELVVLINEAMCNVAPKAEALPVTQSSKINYDSSSISN